MVPQRRVSGEVCSAVPLVEPSVRINFYRPSSKGFNSGLAGNAAPHRALLLASAQSASVILLNLAEIQQVMCQQFVF